jgi:L-alanine-DL-glutamate epimerase-like enolase superfamily enzyme
VGISDNITRLDVSVYTVPTSSPESDGTYQWDRTTLVLVAGHAAGKLGIGYTYADESTAALIRSHLTEQLIGLDPLDVTAAWHKMVHSIRNLGRPGIASMAISAVDTALWDLKAKILGVPLVKVFGQVHDSMPVYGSGGFTSYTNRQLEDQLGGWVSDGISMVKMKIGRDPVADIDRVCHARAAIGSRPKLFIDANGAYGRKQALQEAEEFTKYNISWFEEPVSSDDLEGLHFIREHAPVPIEVAAGEYGYDLDYFRRMLEAGAVDVLQADATRCAGFTGFLQAANVCEARHVPLSAHCAPALHVHVACAAQPMRHIEYFHDHVRIENMFFDGVPKPVNGALHPDLSRPGIGLELKRADAERFAA